ncbi:MAG: prolyl oligopeptidase family serine peptidase [Phycisphaerales bacterium]|nr:prolyl oligopeptidase family serine peptidase [Phycisphaerales bacterium]
MNDVATNPPMPAFQAFAPLVARGLVLREFQATLGDRTIPAIIALPPQERLHANPVLLLTIGGALTHFVPPNQQPAEYFWAQGHPVVSFNTQTMPGDLSELCQNILKAADPFEIFIQEARAVLDHCIAEGWTKPDRIVVSGISRYGYLAFRLMAADQRLKIGAGFSLVTDWRDLSEFANHRDMKRIADLRLSLFANQLVGKHIYMAIGSHDERVSTLSACRFFLDLNEANQKRGLGPELIDFHVTPDIGHTCGNEWYQRGMEILLDRALHGTNNQPSIGTTL